LAAEARALYFSDLAAMYSRRKQIITGVSFFLASGAAATLIARTPVWVPTLLAVVTAILNAYSVAISLDRKVTTMVKLGSTWRQIATEYERLWNHTYEPNAEQEFDKIVEMESAPSDLAATDAPYDPKRIDRWQRHVFQMYHLPA
jgi:ABC-type transport system involved in Fe-S cluster assembly fused permease/ATPase subunit